MSAASEGRDLASTPPVTPRAEPAGSSAGSELSAGRGRWPGGRYSGKQLLLALAVAALADGLSLVLTLAPPVQWAIDGTTAVLLFAVLGWHWALLPGLVMEAIPGLYVFPFWILVIASLAAVGSVRGGRKAALAPARGD